MSSLVAPRSASRLSESSDSDDTPRELERVMGTALSLEVNGVPPAPPLRRKPSKARRVVGSAAHPEAAATVTAAAPLGQRLVGGIPNEEPAERQECRQLERVQMQRELTKQQRSLARVEKQQHAAGHQRQAPRPRPRPELGRAAHPPGKGRPQPVQVQRGRAQAGRGAQRRGHRVRGRSLQPGGVPGGERDQQRQAPIASAALWAIVLAQEAWRRTMAGGRWEVNSVEGKHNLSFEAFEKIYHMHKGDRKRQHEYHADDAKAFKHRYGVTRTICSHSFGSRRDKLQKIRCLDMLLKRANDQGLHAHIREMLPPLVEPPQAGGPERADVHAPDRAAAPCALGGLNGR